MSRAEQRADEPDRRPEPAPERRAGGDPARAAEQAPSVQVEGAEAADRGHGTPEPPD